jgi:hypothetical protein
VVDVPNVVPRNKDSRHVYFVYLNVVIEEINFMIIIAFSENDHSRITLCDGDCVLIEGTPQQLLKLSRWEFLSGVCRAAIENQDISKVYVPCYDRETT